MKTPYEVLQVNTNATLEVIKAAYRTLAKEHCKSEPKLKQLNLAKDILFDEDERAKFDKEQSKLIGNYKIIKELAVGGFGRTYLAKHIVLDSLVCIKQAYGVSEEDEKILLEEAQAIWDLRHFGIPAIRDIVRMPDNSILLIMSYITGPTLNDILEKHKKLDAEHVAWITERVLNILKYLHFHGVVHGDIKPQNIIIQPESHTVVLVDYGLSIIRPSSKSSGKGYTPIYVAPEQMGDSPLLPETDFYGLGVTMIAALGGDIERREVPDSTPDNMCKFIKKLIVHNVLARPNWSKIDLLEQFQNIREQDFGRKNSNMKKFDF